MFQSMTVETMNCSSVDSALAMSSVYDILDSHESETIKSLRAAGLIVVDFAEEIEFTVF